MKYDVMSQTAKLLQQYKKNKRWLAVFLCLAVTVVLGTLAALKLYGQAMTHKVKVLECKYEVHEHTEECYDAENGEELICVYADYVVHVHNDDCYDAEGKLVCPLEEVEPHEHTEECYEEIKVLVCGKEAGEIEEGENGEGQNAEAQEPVKGDLTCTQEEHTHGEDCYSRTLTCETEEHTHGAECRDEEGNLVCTKEEHTHGEDCYNKELTCTTEEHTHDDGCYEWITPEQPEAPETKGHVHTDECYVTEKVLACGKLELHTHTDECYAKESFDEEGKLIEGSLPVCGLLQLEEHVHGEECFVTVELTAEEVEALKDGATLHVHDEKCYDEEGNLICGHEATHIHGPECYDDAGKVICGQSLGAHVHEAKCYNEEGKLICGYETAAHPHVAGCYDAEGNLQCGYETATHVHEESCYDAEGNLICGYAAASHVHGKECYDENGTLICGYETAKHVHEDSCYDQEGNLVCGYDADGLAASALYCDESIHTHDADCYDAEGNLICGKADFAVHKHTDDCYNINGVLICPLPEVEAHVHGAECYPEGTAEGGAEPVCGKQEIRLHTHTEDCYDENGALICGQLEILEHVHSEACKTSNRPITKTFEGESFIVTAVYKPDANIPEEAELIAEQITEESDSEHFAKRQAEYQEALGDNKATMRALLKVGFYVNGEEVEPESPVTLTIQFLDENGLAEGKPVTVIHFADEGAEVLEGSEVQDGSTTFEMDSFSEIGIGNEREGVTIPISQDYEYEDDNFYIVFHVEGEVTIPVEQLKADEAENDKDLEQGEGFDEENKQGNGTATEDDAVDGVVSIDRTEPEGSLAEQMEFTVKPLDSTSNAYTAFSSYTEDENEGNDLSVFQVLSYTLVYEGQELDLSDCTVTAMITPSVALLDSATDYIETYTTEEGEVVENGLAINVYEQTEAGEINGLDSLYITEEVLIEAENQVVAGIAGYSINNDEMDAESEDGEEDGSTAESDAEGSAEAENTDRTENPVSEEEEFPLTMKVRLASTTFAVKGVSSKANPSFQVQYYAWLERLDTSANKQVVNNRVINSLIDTSGKHLPINGVTPTLKYFKVGADGKITSKEILTQIYKEKTFYFAEAPDLAYFDEVTHVEEDAEVDKGSYILSEIWVTTNKTVAAGTNKDEWTIYDPNTVKFTNRKETYQSDPKHYVWITKDTDQDTYIRLVYKVKDNEKKSYDATFYDYDIGSNWDVSGTVKKMNTASSGINSRSNCDKDVKYAFGNKNTGTKYGENTWKDGDGYVNLFNAGNRKSNGGTDSHLLCTFGLVSGVDGSNLKFNVPAPSVFGNSAEGVAGKSIYDDYDLIFDRKGDTYTLQAVYNKEFGDVASELDILKHPSYGNTVHKHIWSNLFWPMDAEREKYPNGHDFMFGEQGQQANQKGTGTELPISDDGKNHNCFFGMYYELTFDLSEEYTGPLEYYFFGDDDMWVFLDGQLVCDIGGVHLVVGEYVNLWDYLGTANPDGTGSVAEGKAGKHKLQFFYTERGASGSTCWMQFTLPSVESDAQQIKGQVTNTLKVTKALAGTDKPEGLEYEFQINFKNEKGPLLNNYSYAKMDSKGNIIKETDSDGKEKELNDVLISDGGTFVLGDGEYIEINYLPVGTTYTIRETGRAFKKGESDPIKGEKDKYDVTVDTGNGTNEGEVTDGKVDTGNISITYINDYGYKLPETGGSGTVILYTMAGVIVLLGGAGFLYKRKFRERRV